MTFTPKGKMFLLILATVLFMLMACGDDYADRDAGSWKHTILDGIGGGETVSGQCPQGIGGDSHCNQWFEAGN